MKIEKKKRLLSFMLACLLVLNVPMSALGSADVPMTTAETADEATAPKADVAEPADTSGVAEPEEPEMSEVQEPDAEILDAEAADRPWVDESTPESETTGQSTQETVPGLDEELVIADGDVPTEALPETEAPKLPAPDMEASEPETEADEETEAETAPEAALADVQFALAEPGEDAGQEAYLSSRQDEQDGSYIVTLPATEEPIETIYVKPELTDPVCFVFAKAGENEAVELTDQAWTAVDIRALEVPAQEETAVILTVSATEDAEAEGAAQYAVRFEQETAQSESGTETEEESETETETEAADTEEATETEAMPDAAEASSEAIEVPETEPEEILETESEAMDAANAGESESGSESESGNESESGAETEAPPMKLDSLEFSYDGSQWIPPEYNESEKTYTFKVNADKSGYMTQKYYFLRQRGRDLTVPFMFKIPVHLVPKLRMEAVSGRTLVQTQIRIL